MAKDCAGFESYLRGAWWDIQIKQERSCMFLISYNAPCEEELAWLPITELRMRSRKADDWDCYFLKKGVDVSVLSEHPHTKDLNLHKDALYDAKISSVKSFDHVPGQCSCKFLVQFFSVRVETYPGGLVRERTLLTDIPAVEVPISKLRILQQLSERISLRDVLEAHMEQKWIPMGRGCMDAIFLTETDLRSSSNRKRIVAQEYIPSPDMRTRMRSCEEMSGSGAKLSTRSGDKESNCNSLVGSERDTPGSRPAPDKLKPHQMPDGTPGEVQSVEEERKGRNSILGDKAAPVGIGLTTAGRSPPDVVQIESSSDSDMDVDLEKVKTDRDVDKRKSNRVGRPKLVVRIKTDHVGRIRRCRKVGKHGDSARGVNVSKHQNLDKTRTKSDDRHKRRGRPRKDKSNLPQVSILQRKDDVKTTNLKIQDPWWSGDSEKSDSEGEWKPARTPIRQSTRLKNSKP